MQEILEKMEKYINGINEIVYKDQNKYAYDNGHMTTRQKIFVLHRKVENGGIL